ncbi:metallophosphoesterase [Paenibacillus sp. YN15]|uniref:metallophosphoesterase n=1 Tax=Paenibacillus sp. YN15 TaxID=1742774 RepID=UPI000DCE8FEF|nr:AAA family ATPase [Paenibacillus sp. YN15]RAU98878.1 metallophosphoesterase [Paenibacillus sp. YN15]
MEIRADVHTVFMLVGSTECGKTTFAKEVLIPGLRFEDAGRNIRANIQYLSSDAIRQEVLGYEYDKYDQVMLEASEQAFQLLFEKLKAATSFPVNAEFVVVDTTGLSEDFRARVKEIAHQNNYKVEAIVFDYRKREDYYASERSKKLITSHINRLKKEVLGGLPREGYDNIHKVRAKDFYLPEEGLANPAYTVAIGNLEDYLAAVLPQDRQYIIIGDIHECVDDLKGLLLDHGFKLNGGRLEAAGKVAGTKLVLVGDWIDKGRCTRETIEFLYENRDFFYFVLGNHENFVDKYLKGEVAGVEQELLDSYFDSVQVLAKEPELLAKFRHLVSLSQPFYRYAGIRGPSFYVTHAPCRKKYIGKLDTGSRRHQRNLRINREEPLEGQLAFLQEEAVANHPYHIFGHIAAAKTFRFGNKIHIDTGCAHGNQLTSVSIGYKPFYKNRKAARAAVQEELPVLFREERKVALRDLGEEDIRRLHYCSRNQVNFISGTMSPADKDEAAGELESLERGLAYFREHDVGQVVLQPKYMGSRCNIYLHRDLEQCFAVSRNGYRMKQPDMTSVYGGLLEKFGGYMAEQRVTMLVLDGELLPWRALGEGLINRQFAVIGKALETELGFLAEHGFEAAYGKLLEDYEASGFEKDQHHTAKGELMEKYGSHVYQNYKDLYAIRQTYVPLAGHEAAYETYKRQLELYAKEGELEYKPFAVLKLVKEEGTEELPRWSTSEMFRFLSEDEALVLDLSDGDAVGKAEEFFAKLTAEEGMEGVVIKPELWDGKTVPYMKVRNADYLSIIYGYDYRFPHKYRKLMKQKSIREKLRTSQNEYQLGLRMLEIPFGSISPEHEGYKEIAASLLFEVAQEQGIDPRL